MANHEVYRIQTAEGHEYDWHLGVAALQDTHPGAVITGRRVVSSVGEGTYEPYSIAKAQAAERKEAVPAAKAPKADKPATAKGEKAADKAAEAPAP